MKKIKANRKIIIGLLIGIIISGVTSYAVAATLINSQDVAYDDKTSGLGANNVQSAIDKTCSNIDTRLSEIEDNLYTIKSFNNSVTIPGTVNYAYTGVSINVPANSYCSITATAIWAYGAPSRVGIDDTTTADNYPLSIAHQHTGLNPGQLSTTFSGYNENAKTYYIFAQYGSTNAECITYSGFCATKI